MSLSRKFHLLLLGLLLHHEDAKSIFMWTAPLPAWNQTVQGADPPNIQTAVVRVLNGTNNFILRWQYRLLYDQTIGLTNFFIDDGIKGEDDIGFVAGSPTVFDKDGYRTRFHIKSNREFSSLTINVVTERENATFQCKVSLRDGRRWAYNIRIEVTVPPKITQISNNKTVIKSDKVSLICTAVGYPTPAITWTRLRDNKVVTMPLIITDENDGGPYRCTANNGVGNPSSKDVSITVRSPPEITKPSIVTWEVTTGDSVIIECHANGSPRPKYRWSSGDGRVVADTKRLHVQNVNTSHGGHYTCKAWNSLGSANLTITINVSGTTPFKEQTINTTVASTPEKKEIKTSPDDTSQYILIGVGSGGFLVVAVVIAVALCYWRVESKRGKEESSVRNNYEQEGVENQSVPEITCPPVDRSKKPKKKSKPGELHYADLEDFHTSDRALSSNPPFPARKPPPYGNTEYAVITDIIWEGSPGFQTAAANSYGDIV